LSKKVFFAGEAYAGKYIPDLVLRVVAYNDRSDDKININGIMVGNGIMDLSDDSLENSQV
jgi:carboxypeptidase C (cathepsin A)